MDKYKEVVETLIRFRAGGIGIERAVFVEKRKPGRRGEPGTAERGIGGRTDLFITAGREAPSGHLRHCAGKNPEERGEISGRKSKRDS